MVVGHDGFGHGVGVAVGSGDGLGEGLTVGSGEGLGEGVAVGSGEGLGDGSTANAGTTAIPRIDVAMRAAVSQRMVRSRPEARNPKLAIAMLPSLGVGAHTGHGSRGLPRPGRPGYQHAMSRGTVAGVLRIYLGHGAAGSAATMAPWVDGLRARGYEAHALTLPRRKAEDAVAAFEAQVPDEPGVVVGGHSFGGRVASLSAAGVGRTEREQGRRYAGLVCLSYPLHRPGYPETAGARTAHWPRIAVPALLCSGTSDPFARLDLLEVAMPMLALGRLETWPRLGHGLLPVREAVLDRIAAFLTEVEPTVGG